MLSKHAHKTNLSWALPDLEDVNHFLVNQNTLILLSTRLKSGLLEHWYLFHSSIDLTSRPNMCICSWLPSAKFININPAGREICFCSYLDFSK